MKKTKYFSVNHHPIGQTETAINKVSEKRDAWLTENKNSIGRIDNEDMKIAICGSGLNHVLVVIQLTYFPKE